MNALEEIGTFEELTAKQAGRPDEGLRGGTCGISSHVIKYCAQVDNSSREIEFDMLPIGNQPRVFRLAENRANFRETPAERAFWIVGTVPKQLAQAVPGVRPTCRD